MKLKAPTPLGGGSTIEQPPVQTVTPKKELHIPRFKLNIPRIKLPKLNLTSEQKHKVIYISAIGIPLLLLIILVIVILTYTKSEPYRISREFLQRIEDRDVSGAYEMTTDAYRVVVSEKDFKDVVTRLNSVDLSNPKVKSKSIQKTNDMGSYASIKYKISGYYVDIVLFNDTKDWGILSIELTTIQ